MTRMIGALLIVAVATLGATTIPAIAQGELGNVLGDIGTAQAIDGDDADEDGLEPNSAFGAISGSVFDASTGAPVRRATVILMWPESESDDPGRQEVAVAADDGTFRFDEITPGPYALSFVKSGYRAGELTGVSVEAGQSTRADFPLPPLAAATRDEVLNLDAYIVEQSVVDGVIGGLELRMDSDVQLNVMTAEDLAKYSASDVADALRRVSGVNIVEGQFAIIRGLEDRYSSTLYNGAPVPSPDPSSQSVQLDLFPSGIVTDLAIAKTFTGTLPGNSSGGSIDVMTIGYPEEFEAKVKIGAGVNTNALDDFLRFDSRSPVGIDKNNPIETETGASLGGRYEAAGREVRYKGLFNWKTDYDTAKGYQQTLEPKNSVIRRGVVTQPGDLALGQLNLTAGRFDLQTSGNSQRLTGYAGLGVDLDRKGNHRIDGSFFYTKKKEEVVQTKTNGYLNNFDYTAVIAKTLNEQAVDYPDFSSRATERSWIAGRNAVREFSEEPASRGPLWYTNFQESKAFQRNRDLLIAQVNGESEFEALEGLDIGWAANYARTNQHANSRGLRFFYEPFDTSTDNVPTSFPVLPQDLGAGLYAANDGVLFNTTDIFEEQGFGRLDIEYERDLHKQVEISVQTGGWYEYATRHVDASFLESPTAGGTSQYAAFGETPSDLGSSYFDDLDRATTGQISGVRNSSNDSEREIAAFAGGLRGTFFEQVDLLGGVRVESIKITSNNDPFTGELTFGAPQAFPPVYLFFDRLDSVSRGEVTRAPPPGTTFNDQLLGVQVPIDPVTGLVDLLDRATIDEYVNGEIDETKVLPMAGIVWRPLEGMSLRASYSQTVARPSFREMGYYVSVDPGTDDLEVGNPQLKLSDVESVDFRAEYFWGDLGDLLAFSVFYKTIDDPIEGIVIRNPLNFENSSDALYRTYFNNPNQAELWGLELEARKAIDFVGIDFAKYFSLGGNFTYIDAQVDRVEFEIDRVQSYFATPPDVTARYNGLKKSRRLFGQPEWIANVDVTFNQPDWGTTLTLAYFTISDVLASAGSVFIEPNGSVDSYTPDRYIDKYHTLDLIVSQTWEPSFIKGDLTMKFSAKNLTNSTRRIIYDPSQTASRTSERGFRLGRDFKLTLTYRFY